MDDPYMGVIADLHTRGLISDECVIKLGRMMKLAADEKATMTKEAAIRKYAVNWAGMGESAGNALRGAGGKIKGMAGAIGRPMAEGLGGMLSGMRGPQPVQSALQSMTGALRSGAQNFMSNPIGQHLALGGALAAGGTVASAIGSAFQKLKVMQAKSQMFQQFPDLAHADPAQVDQVFDTVSAIAPHVASQPRLVGTFVQGVLQFPGAAITPEMGQSLMRLEEQLVGQPGAGAAFMEGAMGQAGKGLVMGAIPQKKDIWDKANIMANVGKTVGEIGFNAAGYGGPMGVLKSLAGKIQPSGPGYQGAYKGSWEANKSGRGGRYR